MRQWCCLRGNILTCVPSAAPSFPYHFPHPTTYSVPSSAPPLGPSRPLGVRGGLFLSTPTVYPLRCNTCGDISLALARSCTDHCVQRHTEWWRYHLCIDQWLMLKSGAYVKESPDSQESRRRDEAKDLGRRGVLSVGGEVENVWASDRVLAGVERVRKPIDPRWEILTLMLSLSCSHSDEFSRTFLVCCRLFTVPLWYITLANNPMGSRWNSTEKTLLVTLREGFLKLW